MSWRENPTRVSSASLSDINSLNAAQIWEGLAAALCARPLSQCRTWATTFSGLLSWTAMSDPEPLVDSRRASENALLV